MTDNRENSYSKRHVLRKSSALLFVFLIAFSSISSFSSMIELESDKIENLVEGKGEIDLEEKEKNIEVEENPMISQKSKNVFSTIDRLHNDLYATQFSWHHLKTPTPPPENL